MPLYEVRPVPLYVPTSYLNNRSITPLPSPPFKNPTSPNPSHTTFRTPSLFVNLRFVPAEPTGDYFVAGKPTSPNRIVAMVRTGGSGRSKETFDELARKIEAVWEDVVVKENSGGGRKLYLVAFTPMVAALENGFVIPGAGEEGSWLKNNMAYFTECAEVGDDEHFKDMLKEIEDREDLKSFI